MNNIAIIGAGKIAWSLTKALLDGGYKVGAVCSQSLLSAGKLAEKFNIPCYTDKVSGLPLNTTLFIIAVPDMEIENAAKELASWNFNFQDSLCVHLSGSQDLSPLKILKETGASCASFHIMQTFPSHEAVDIKHSYVAVETEDEDSKEFLFMLARRLLLMPFSIDSEKKAFYHMTGVFASNFLVAGLYNALLSFKQSGIKDTEFFSLVKPIIQATLTNIEKEGLENALSGPVARGDIQTVKNHIAKLKDTTLSQKGDGPSADLLLSSYILNSLTLIELLRTGKAGLSKNQSEIASYLTDMLNKEKDFKGKF